MSSSVYTLKAYDMKFHLLDHLVEEIKRARDMSVFGELVHEQCSVHIKNHTEGRPVAEQHLCSTHLC